MPDRNERHVVPNPNGGWDVEKPDAERASSHHHTQAAAEDRAKEIVANLGGPGGGGWRLTRAEVIQRIDGLIDTFYTMVGGRRANVLVVKDGIHEPYLRTFSDGYWNDNLLALPECR